MAVSVQLKRELLAGRESPHLGGAHQMEDAAAEQIVIIEAELRGEGASQVVFSLGGERVAASPLDQSQKGCPGVFRGGQRRSAAEGAIAAASFPKQVREDCFKYGLLEIYIKGREIDCGGKPQLREH